MFVLKNTFEKCNKYTSNDIGLNACMYTFNSFLPQKLVTKVWPYIFHYSITYRLCIFMCTIKQTPLTYIT